MEDNFNIKNKRDKRFRGVNSRMRRFHMREYPFP